MKNEKLLVHIAGLIIALLPVAWIYSFPIFINNFGHFLLLFVVFPILFITNGKNKVGQTEKKYIKYFLYLIAISFIIPNFRGYGMASLELIMLIEFVIIGYYLIVNQKICDYFLKVYKSFAFFFTIYLLGQFTFFTLFHISVSGFIPFLSFYNAEGGFESVRETERMLHLSSVFTERAHFCQYVVPAIVLYLWDVGGKSRRKKLMVSLMVVSVFLSTSSNGIVSVSIVLAIYIINKYFYHVNVKHIYVGLFILLAGGMFLMRSAFVSNVTYGLFIKDEGQSNSKAYVRMYRGFLLFYELPKEEKLIGCGWRNCESCIKSKNYEAYELLFMDNFEYMNSIAQVLCYSGIIGFLLFVFFMISVIKLIKHMPGVLVIIVIIMFMSSSSILMTDMWFLYLAIIYSLKNIYEKEYLYIEANGKRDCHLP